MPIFEHTGPDVAPAGVQEVRLGGGSIIWSAGADLGGDIEDFESGDLSAYFGDTDDFTIQSYETVEGDNALRGEERSSSARRMIHSTPGDGLDHYPQQGERIYWWGMAPDEERPYLSFGGPDYDNTYTAYLAVRDNEIWLRRRDEGSATWLASESVGLSGGTWYENRIEWYEDGRIRYSVHDSNGDELEVIEATDTTYSERGVGWGYNSNTSGDNTCYYDYVWSEALPERVVVDDFEDGDLSEYSGNDGDFSVVSGTSWEGSYALYRDTETEFNGIYSQPGDGLPEYPSRGDRIKAYYKLDGEESKAAFRWAGQNPVDSALVYDDQYYIYIQRRGSNIALWKATDGDATQLDETDVTVPGDWIELDISYGDPTISVTVINTSNDSIVTELSADDTDHTDGGIGISDHSGDQVEDSYWYADYITTRSTG